MLALHKAALTDLERRLRPVIGAVDVRGFPHAGRISLESLFQGDLSFGMMDGLMFQSVDSKSEMLVTTRGLLSAWLAEMAYSGRRPSVEEFLRSPDVFGAAFSRDDAAYRYADLPIPDANGQGITSAMLIVRAQDDRAEPPDMFAVSVVRGDRIFILEGKPAVAIDTLAVCNTPIHAVFKAAADSGIEAQIRLNHDSLFAAYRACYGEHLSIIPGIDRIIRQVSTLVTALPQERAHAPTRDPVGGLVLAHDLQAKLSPPVHLIVGDANVVRAAGDRRLVHR